jgi:hypothetical protein
VTSRARQLRISTRAHLQQEYQQYILRLACSRDCPCDNLRAFPFGLLRAPDSLLRHPALLLLSLPHNQKRHPHP